MSDRPPEIVVSDAVLAAVYAGVDPDEIRDMVEQAIEWAQAEIRA